jgi:hypothetical protein
MRMSREPRATGVTRAIRVGLVACALVAAPRAALACPVCFGQNDSPLALGINYGILAMLGIIVAFWIAFGSFFIYLARRARRVEAAAAGSADPLSQSHVDLVPGALSTRHAKADAGFRPQMQGGAL